MARAFWKGTLSFGLVEIPVSLRKAVDSDELHFALLDARDFSPVGYKHYNKSTGREVEWNDVVRGYEYEPDQYVVLSDAELDAANVEATQSIDILQFVEAGAVPPMYFDTPYFVEPVRRNSRSYVLLRAALERSGRIGIARVVLRTRQHLAALLVRDRSLMLDLLRYPHELREPARDEQPETEREAKITPRELQMAERLIAGMTAPWNPGAYHDEYRDDVLALVKRKVESGQTHEIVETAPARKPPAREVVDLMPLLQKSVERYATRGGAARASAATPSASRRPRRAPPRRARAATAPRKGRRSA